jgi:subtilisin family serine protease
MKSKYKLKSIVAAMGSTFVLTGCGGGGGGGTTPVYETEPEAVVVSPTYYKQQTLVNVLAAWDEGAKGAGQTIAIIDSGVNVDHDDFKNSLGDSRINAEDATGFDYDQDRNVVQVPTYTDTDTTDYHGTHVASIAAGSEYGLAPEATILPINVFQDNNTVWSDILAEAITYTAPKADVMNASISGMINLISVGADNPYDKAVTALTNNQTILVSAAGNNGDKRIGVDHFENNNIAKNLGINPLVEGRVFNVIALNDDFSVADFSNAPGSCADISANPHIPCDVNVMTQIQNTFIAAPGVWITAADGATTDSSTAKSGTSMAAPVVSGALATLLSTWDQLTPTQASQIVRDTADRSFAGYAPELYGVGILDVEAAMSPIGVLKAASTGTGASVKITDVSAKVPSSLEGIKDIPALKKAAFYDDYNRDYAFDMSKMVQVEKTPIDWNAHWNQSIIGKHYTRSADLGFASLTMAVNPSQPDGIQSLSLAGQNYSFSFGQDYAVKSGLESLAYANDFVGLRSSDETRAFAGNYRLNNGLSLVGDVKWKDSYSLVSDSDGVDTSSQFGLMFQATDNLTLGAGVEWINQTNSFAGMSGEGTLSFGENNLTQLGVLSANYKHGANEFFGLFKAGKLADNQSADYQYLSIKDATLGQTVLGFRSMLDKKSQFGLQAYNDLSVTDASMSLHIPTGMDSEGNMEFATEKFNYKGNLAPNTFEAFYKVSPAKGMNYMLNAVSSPDDVGVGLRMETRF